MTRRELSIVILAALVTLLLTAAAWDWADTFSEFP